MEYWYNMRTGKVESDEERGPGQDVMGPYESREEAARALEIARARSEKWDADDREWSDRGAAPGWSRTED